MNPVPPGSDSDSPLLNGIRVLLVEDYPINLKMALRFLLKWGAVVETADNGQVALDKCRASDFDIILMDLEMPVMDGYTATAEIRKFNPAVPIIALTAADSVADGAQTSATGLTDYVSKPFSPSVLLAKMARYCQPL